MKNILITLSILINLIISSLAKAEPSPIFPDHLKPGDTVGLVSSGFRAPDDQSIHFAAERLQALGLKVKYGKFLFQHQISFSGSDKERAQDLNDMFADPQVKAIFEVRGGWGSNKILPLLDYKIIKKNPKIIIGFSDITSLLLAIQAKTGLVTFHGTMGIEPWPKFTVDYMKRVLFSGEKTIFANPSNVDPQSDLIQTDNRIQTITGGTAKGKLLGGNMAVITSMLGSEYLPKWKGSILFLEDVGEDYYKIDRMMAQLQMSGVLNQISGFVFGQCMDCTSTTTMIGSVTLSEILNHYIKPLGIPAWSGAMIGHMPQMFTLPEGAMVEINADKGTITMLDPAVKL